MKIRHRIMLWVAGAGLLSSLAFSLVVFLEMRELPLEMMDSQLQAEASAVVRQLSVQLSGQLSKAQKPLTGEQAKTLFISSEHYWIKVYDEYQRPVYQSDLSRAADIPLYRDKGEEAYMVSAPISRKGTGLHQNSENEVMFRVRVMMETIAGSSYLVQIARPMEDINEETFDLLGTIGIGLAVSIALLVGLSYMLAGQIVKPIAVINRLSSDINGNTLERRIPLGKSRDEIYELADRLNQMFDRLQFSFARQKQFLADAAHELKTPIAMLRLFFDEALQGLDLPESFQQKLDAQGRNVLRMDRLVKTLLELSILEIKTPLALEPFNLTDLARSVQEDFAPLMEIARIRPESKMPQEIEIWGDKDKIRRALINIFDNAIKYNKEDGRIEFAVIEKKEGIHLSLYNTGIGIPKEKLSKVFDAFYRVDKSRSTESGGAGLGLSIVREIVRLHQGEISIDSQQGLWTRVDIFLPQHNHN
jgi:two-component system, OmpR family, sensor kinase